MNLGQLSKHLVDVLRAGRAGSTVTVSGPAKTGVEMRQQIAKSLNGVGVEFGAGAVDTAFPIPPGAKMLYADVNQQAELSDRNYFHGRELVVPDLHTGIEQMDGILPESLDFVIASHVIEHTRNPIRALHLAHEKLRTGGRIVLVVPDQASTDS